jgi:hypothetical protein
MALDANVVGGASGLRQEVDSNLNAFARLPGYDALGVARGGGDGNSACNFGEIDNGTVFGARTVLSGEVDDDYRQRVAHDNWLDEETFIDTAQNTGKHSHTFTTLTATMSTAGLLTNSGNITTTTTGMTFGTFAMFPVVGTQTLVCETTAAFTAQPNANQVIDFGIFQRGASTPFAPLDGAYFRMSSTGFQGVINVNGTETTTAVFPLSGGTGTFVISLNTAYKWLIQTNNVKTTFWINNVKYGEIINPVGAGGPCLSRALPWSVRHAIAGGTAGSALQMLIKGYRIILRGPQYADSLGTVCNRVYGAYQGLSGGTLGTIGTYTNSTNPTAAVPTNTTLAVGAAGLLNQAWETFTLAVNTDGILLSYQVPAGSTTIQGRRLRVTGVKLSSFVQTVLVGGPCNRVFALAFGGTTVSLATAETGSFVTATAKTRRIVLLPELTQVITAAQAVSTMISQPQGSISMFPEPIFVNPGEFVQVIEKIIGTVGTSGTIVNHIQLIYSWE